MAVLVRWVCAAAPGILAACGSPEAVQAQTAGVRELVERLGSPDTGVREEAERELRRLGEKAENELRRWQESADPEVRSRVRRLVERLEWNRNPPVAFVAPSLLAGCLQWVDPVTGRVNPLLRGDAGSGIGLSHLEWSPDGLRLAYGDSGAGLVLVSWESRKPEVLTSLHVRETRSMSWSPDGRHVVFVSQEPSAPGAEKREHVCVVGADRREVACLTSGDHNNFDPCWSPDGKRIAFTSDRGRLQEEWDIYVMDAKGGEARRLTSDGSLKTGLAWSPDGKSIVFSWEKEGGILGILEVAQGRVRRLTEKGRSEGLAAWSPDGGMIVFARGREGSDDHDLWILDGDGRRERIVAAGEGDKSFPRWSPDGRRIAFLWARDGASQIWLVQRDGTGMKQVTRIDGGAELPAWAPFR